MQNLDDALVTAVQDAVKDAGQPAQVAKRLLIWMDALSSGEASIERPQDVSERLDLVLKAIDIPKGAGHED